MKSHWKHQTTIQENTYYVTQFILKRNSKPFQPVIIQLKENSKSQK